MDPLDYWRERILLAILGGGFFTGFIAYIPGMILAVKERFWSLMLFDTLVMVLAGLLFFKKDLKYIVRALCAILLCYLLGVWLIVKVGFASGGLSCLFTFSILAGILIGLRSAWIAVLANVVTLGVVIYLMPGWQGAGAWSSSISLERLVSAAATFIFTNTMITLTLAVLLEGLQTTSRKEKESLEKLRQEHSRLKEVRDALQKEIDRRMETEGALRQSESRFREMAELFPATIFEIDSNGKLLFVNRIAFDQFGYTQDDFEKGLYALDIVAEDDREKARHNLQRSLMGEKIELIEYKLLRKDQTVFPGAVQSARMVLNGKPAGLRGVVLDLSQIKSLEAQLFQAQKMEAIGTLAGGIAHDFNNLLMGILGRISILALDDTLSETNRNYLKEIEEHVHSAANLTRRLLGFARGGRYEVKSTDLNELVNKSVTLFGRTKKEIKIHKKYQEGIYTVDVDRSQIEQVLLNMFVNAAQAMDGTGDLYLETGNVLLGEEDAPLHSTTAGKFVKIVVRDTGCGMDEATQKKVFDPFFTTKEKGRGTGLGLASAYGIIKNHGGFITLKSRLGEGSEFSIFIPASLKALEKETSSIQMTVRGSETILLIDDEEMIIDVGKAMLEKLGYRVYTARTGKEGIHEYGLKKEEIDLVILDIIMPDLSGGETFDMLKMVNPDIRVLLSSGYSMDGHAQGMMDRGCKGFIQKPFGLQRLSEKIREILDHKSA
jgi:PAS domain S-box-containing protein